MNIHELTYYCFDFDDNILHMNTKIHIEKLSENGTWEKNIISTSEFSEIRKNRNKWRFPNGDDNQAFAEFCDNGPRGSNAFIEDSIEAIKNKRYAPSWNKLIECLVEGNIFAIITARGHEPETIRKVIRYIIDNELTKKQKAEMVRNLLIYISKFIKKHDPNKPYTSDELIEEYLDKCDFYGVTSDDFKQYYDTDASKPEEAKEIALKMFTERVHKFGERIKAKVHIGFSDDDKGNIEIIEKLFKDELSLKFRQINFNIYDTSNPKIKDGVRIKINH
jgi:hypothetical protein